MKHRIVLMLLLVCIVTVTAATSVPGTVSAAPDVKISEIRIDQPADDEDEYFELSGAPSTSLNGLTYLVIGDGSGPNASGVIEEVTSLTGQSIALFRLFCGCRKYVYSGNGEPCHRPEFRKQRQRDPSAGGGIQRRQWG